MLKLAWHSCTEIAVAGAVYWYGTNESCLTRCDSRFKQRHSVDLVSNKFVDNLLVSGSPMPVGEL